MSFPPLLAWESLVFIKYPEHCKITPYIMHAWFFFLQILSYYLCIPTHTRYILFCMLLENCFCVQSNFNLADKKKSQVQCACSFRFVRAHILSYPHLFKCSFLGSVFCLTKGNQFWKTAQVTVTVFYSLSGGFKSNHRELHGGKTSYSIINVSWTIVKLQYFDTSLCVKDHVGNAIMQMIGFRRECLSVNLLYKKTNIGKCFSYSLSLAAGCSPSCLPMWAGMEGFRGISEEKKMHCTLCFAVSGLSIARQQVHNAYVNSCFSRCRAAVGVSRGGEPVAFVQPWKFRSPVVLQHSDIIRASILRIASPRSVGGLVFLC